MIASWKFVVKRKKTLANFFVILNFFCSFVFLRESKRQLCILFVFIEFLSKTKWKRRREKIWNRIVFACKVEKPVLFDCSVFLIYWQYRIQNFTEMMYLKFEIIKTENYVKIKTNKHQPVLFLFCSHFYLLNMNLIFNSLNWCSVRSVVYGTVALHRPMLVLLGETHGTFHLRRCHLEHIAYGFSNPVVFGAVGLVPSMIPSLCSVCPCSDSEMNFHSSIVNFCLWMSAYLYYPHRNTHFEIDFVALVVVL